MKERGRIRVGAYADLVLFDPGQVRDASTYENAAAFSEGIRHVLVNGVPVVQNGAIIARRLPGRAIRAPAAR